MSKYNHIRILLSDKGGFYESRVIDAPVSGGHYCTFNISDEEKSFIEKIENKIKNGNTAETEIQDYGGLLYDKISIGDKSNYDNVRKAIEMNELNAQNNDLDGISIHLEAEGSLRQRYWEFLFDRDKKIWLGRNTKTPISHFVYSENKKATYGSIDKIKLLIAIANPEDQDDQIDEYGEVKLIEEAIGKIEELGFINIEILHNSSAGSLSRKLANYQPHILHFIGHGDNKIGGPFLLLESKTGNNSNTYSVGSLLTSLTQCGSIQLVVLNACLTSEFAYELARLGNVATIGMKSRIRDKAAQCFTHGFYTHLAKGEPIDVCTTYARDAIWVDYSQDRPDWGLPELYLPDGKADIFTDDKDLPILRLMRKYRGEIDLEKQIWPEPKEVFLDTYFIDQYEVTNAEYRNFLNYINRTKDHKYCHPDEPKNKNHTPDYWNDPKFNQNNQPVVGVDWYDAYAYATWAGMKLPSSEQWEKAARGVKGYYYPWGNTFDPTKINEGKNGLSAPLPINKDTADRSPFGVLNMAGNVSEWIGDIDENGFMNICGSDYDEPVSEITALTFFRRPGDATFYSDRLGFRCVTDKKPNQNILFGMFSIVFLVILFIGSIYRLYMLFKYPEKKLLKRI